MWKLVRWLLMLVVLGGIGVAVGIPAQQWYKEKTRPRYLTAKVSRGRVEAVVNSTGTVKPVRSVQVGAFVSGPLEKVFADYNSVVKKGDLLARIDPRLLRAAVERDQAALLTQKAELARVDALLQQAKNNEMRAKKLQSINRDYLSDTEMDQFKFNRQSLEAQRKLALAMISQAEATLENSQTNLGYTEIRAPVNGMVIERKVDPGQTVAATFQTPELFVVAPDMEKHMHVFASVDEADIGLIREAQAKKSQVQFTVDAYPRDLFTGTIYQVRKSSTTTQNVVTYPVVVEAPNPELKLMPGMTANLSFLIEACEDVVRVPVAALRFVPPPARIHPDDRKYLEGIVPDRKQSGSRPSARHKTQAAQGRARRVVWVSEGDRLRAVTVTLGLIDNRYAELLAGDLEEGQEVITNLDNRPAGASLDTMLEDDQL
jgi:HlyD family secretion protein